MKKEKGPEHIREIIKRAKKEWQDAKAIQTMFIYIDNDPQHIRTFYLN